MQNTTSQYSNCIRCGRHLTSAKSRAIGYGPTCARKIRTATTFVSSRTDYSPDQVDSACQLIEDGGILPLRSVIFLTVSTDGTELHRTAPTGCNCKAGLKGGRCYHQLAARMLLAA
ncbi:DUF6011 domain-containing protein [Streptomyces sp. NPDC057910]|uniref:DUF6011 domain-containing protein n=1 Tax=Streptomyces sp. NPDC057910 TaxID=3346278 RepID=UPI0036E9CA7E